MYFKVQNVLIFLSNMRVLYNTGNPCHSQVEYTVTKVINTMFFLAGVQRSSSESNLYMAALNSHPVKLDTHHLQLPSDITNQRRALQRRDSNGEQYIVTSRKGDRQLNHGSDAVHENGKSAGTLTASGVRKNDENMIELQFLSKSNIKPFPESG